MSISFAPFSRARALCATSLVLSLTFGPLAPPAFASNGMRAPLTALDPLASSEPPNPGGTPPGSTSSGSGPPQPIVVPPLTSSPTPERGTVAASSSSGLRLIGPNPAKPFVPFPIVDPATGKPVSASATIINRANGKSVNAGAYWALVNRIERSFNASGHSLREHLAKYDLGRFAGSSQAELEATASKTAPLVVGGGFTGPHVVLGGIAIRGKTLVPSALPSAAASATGTTIICPVDDVKCGKPLSPLPTSVTNGDGTVSAVQASWNPTFGSKDLAQVYLQSLFSAGGKAGSNDPVDLEAKLAVGGYVLGQGGDIASAKGSVANNRAGIDLEVAGQSVYSISETGTRGTKKYSGTFLNPSVSIPVGPIDLDFKLTVGGEVDLAWVLTDQGNAATAGFTPELIVNASFSGGPGLDLGVISGSAGVTINLKLIDVSLPVGEAQLGFTEDQAKTGRAQNAVYACQLRYGLSLFVTEKHTVLAGTGSAYVTGCIDYLIGSYCTTWTTQLFSWNGIQGQNTLIDRSIASTTVGPQYSDLPEYGKPLAPGQVFSADDSSGMPAACHNFGFSPPGAVLQQQ